MAWGHEEGLSLPQNTLSVPGPSRAEVRGTVGGVGRADMGGSEQEARGL